jgi:hypothetical protein
MSGLVVLCRLRSRDSSEPRSHIELRFPIPDDEARALRVTTAREFAVKWEIENVLVGGPP